MSRRAPEQILHRQVAQFLSAALGGDAWFTTIPLGGGGRIRGAILAGLGTKEGIPDIAVVDDGRVVWLELKAPKGRVSQAQMACHAALRRARSPVYVVRSIDDVVAALRDAGVPMRGQIVAGDAING